MPAWMILALLALGIVVIATERQQRKARKPHQRARARCVALAPVDNRSWMSKGARERWENAN